MAISFASSRARPVPAEHRSNFNHLILDIAWFGVLNGSAIAFVAVEPTDGSAAGVVRFHSDADHERGEFAILVRSDQQGRGIGFELMSLMLEWAEADGIRHVYGQVLAENAAMLKMCRDLGFGSEIDPVDADVIIVSREVMGSKT